MPDNHFVPSEKPVLDVGIRLNIEINEALIEFEQRSSSPKIQKVQIRMKRMQIISCINIDAQDSLVVKQIFQFGLKSARRITAGVRPIRKLELITFFVWILM